MHFQALILSHKCQSTSTVKLNFPRWRIYETLILLIPSTWEYPLNLNIYNYVKKKCYILVDLLTTILIYCTLQCNLIKKIKRITTLQQKLYLHIFGRVELNGEVKKNMHLFYSEYATAAFLLLTKNKTSFQLKKKFFSIFRQNKIPSKIKKKYDSFHNCMYEAFLIKFILTKPLWKVMKIKFYKIF